MVGICGGYQMLGATLADPLGIEPASHSVAGLGLLPVTTEFQPTKETNQSCLHLHNADAAWAILRGYEIHSGATTLGSAIPLGHHYQTQRGAGASD